MNASTSSSSFKSLQGKYASEENKEQPRSQTAMQKGDRLEGSGITNSHSETKRVEARLYAYRFEPTPDGRGTKMTFVAAVPTKTKKDRYESALAQTVIQDHLVGVACLRRALTKRELF